MLSDVNTMAAEAELLSHHVHPGFNLFRYNPGIMSRFPRPNLLDAMHIGLLDHLPKWIFCFMKTHKWLDQYIAIWLSVPAYLNPTPKNKSYEVVSQWNDKKMKEISQYLVGVGTQSL
jgi:hypothetical protein